MHAHPIRPERRPTDLRRVIAAALSGLLPGLGQAYNRRRKLATRLLLPSVVVIALAWIVIQLVSPTRLFVWVITPNTLRALLVLNILVLLWRLLAVVQAFFDRRYATPAGRVGFAGLAAIVTFVLLPHAVLTSFGLAAADNFGRIFQAGTSTPGESATPGPTLTQRVNILLIGVDSAPWRNTTLTDSLIVASVDPVGRTATMMSIPRDLVDTPLGNGDIFAPKINSLLSYADRHADEFPEGGTKTLQKAVGSLLGIEIHYTATIDFLGFERVVDILGGVTVDNPKAIDDDNYNAYDGRGQGFKLSKGVHKLSGVDALAYVRSRYTPGDTDFDRAARQQQVLVALKDEFVSQRALFEIPRLLGVLGDSVRTDLPTSLLPELAALSEEIKPSSIVRIVMRSPMLHSGGKNHPFGSVQVPDVELIREVAALAFSHPGTPPKPWPTPKPTKAPAASPSP